MRSSKILTLTFLSFGLATSDSRASAQDSVTRSPATPAAISMALRRFPCPIPVPSGWIVVDSANGRGPFCNLIAAAARGTNQAMFSRGRKDIDPRQALCVTLGVGDPIPALGPLWRVTFYMDSLRGVDVTVDAQGNTIAGVEFDVAKKPLPPLCKRAV
jgi:hypothetical protein